MDIVVGVSLDGLPLSVCLFSAIGIQHDQTNGEELHHLAGVVLIGHTTWGGFDVALGVEVNPHRWAQGHSFQQLAKVAKRMFLQNVPVIGHGELGIATCDHFVE